jgi:TPR repeat protein
MFIQRLIGFSALCLLLASCSTGGPTSFFSREPTTTKGVRYLLGRGVAANDEKAFYYFKAAAEKDPYAQNELAYLYAAGKGTKQDYKQALVWYQKAARHGLASAEYNLGLMYLYGLGTNVDKTVGMDWIKQSALHGFLPAQNEIGKLNNDTHPA